MVEEGRTTNGPTTTDPFELWLVFFNDDRNPDTSA